MAYKKFREFVEARDLSEDLTPPPQQAQPSVNPANKMNVINTLKAAVKAPAPAGANPSQYRNKLNHATTVAQGTNVANPGQAMDIVNVQQKAIT